VVYVVYVVYGICGICGIWYMWYMVYVVCGICGICVRNPRTTWTPELEKHETSIGEPFVAEICVVFVKRLIMSVDTDHPSHMSILASP
jgi:hypothetical protein